MNSSTFAVDPVPLLENFSQSLYLPLSYIWSLFLPLAWLLLFNCAQVSPMLKFKQAEPFIDSMSPSSYHSFPLPFTVKLGERVVCIHCLHLAIFSLLHTLTLRFYSHLSTKAEPAMDPTAVKCRDSFWTLCYVRIVGLCRGHPVR